MLKLPKNEGMNIVPFIDIMLVLLAIVLSISTFIAHGQIKVNLPKSDFSQSQSEDDKKKVLIVVDANNGFFLDDKPADISLIEERLASLARETLVELKSDKDSKFESFVQVINILKNKNHENFQIITEFKQ